MEKLEYKVLELLNLEYAISRIERDFDIKDEDLADIIIGLDDKRLVALKDKKWVIAEKGKEIFEKRDRLLRKLKIDYMYGEIDNKDEYNRRKKELEDISQIISAPDDIIEEKEKKQEQRIEEAITIRPPPEIIIEKKDESRFPKEKEPAINIKKICPKCKIENKTESNFCRKCGTVLKD